GIKDKDGAAGFRLRHMRRAFRIMNETPGGIIANAVIEDAGNYIDLFGPGLMKIDSLPTSARIDLDNLRCRSTLRLPERSHLDGSTEFLFYGRVFGKRPFNVRHRVLRYVRNSPRGASMNSPLSYIFRPRRKVFSTTPSKTLS